MTETYENGDIRRLHERIDTLDKAMADRLGDMAEDMNDAAVAIGKIETRLELQPKPAPRPCPELSSHLAEHKEARRLWERPLVGAIIHLIELGIVALLTWAFVADSRPPVLPTAAGREISQPAAAQGPSAADKEPIQ